MLLAALAVGLAGALSWLGVAGGRVLLLAAFVREETGPHKAAVFVAQVTGWPRFQPRDPRAPFLPPALGPGAGGRPAGVRVAGVRYCGTVPACGLCAPSSGGSSPRTETPAARRGSVPVVLWERGRGPRPTLPFSPGPRCACIDVRHAHKASRKWTLEMDVALVQYINRLCRHLAITPARLHPHEVYLDPADAADPRVACLLSM